MADDEESKTSACWAAVSPSSLQWARWEVDTSLFNADTGETHLLSELPFAVLTTLCERCWMLKPLCTHLALQCDTRDDAAWQETIAGILGGLEELELVERRCDESPRDGNGPSRPGAAQ